MALAPDFKRVGDEDLPLKVRTYLSFNHRLASVKCFIVFHSHYS